MFKVDGNNIYVWTYGTTFDDEDEIIHDWYYETVHYDDGLDCANPHEPAVLKNEPIEEDGVYESDTSLIA